VRHYDITALEDAVIAIKRELGPAALRMMERKHGRADRRAGGGR
jgi:hypothetical protein